MGVMLQIASASFDAEARLGRLRTYDCLLT